MNLAPFKAFIGPREGTKARVYPDGDGRPTVGKGFNLAKPGAEAKLRAVGLSRKAVLAGQVLTTQQINDLFEVDVAEAVADAQRHFPSFLRQPLTVQLILVDLAFNMGLKTLADFSQFRRDIEAGRYASAAGELMFTKPPAADLSEYFTDTKTRAIANIALLFGVERGKEAARGK